MKKNNFIVTLLVYTLLLTKYTATHDLTPMPYVDFDISMQREKYNNLLVDNQLYAYNFFKNAYTQCNPSTVTLMQNQLIPNIIHFIWLGSKLPEKYIPIIVSWATKNPSCMIKIWIDSGLPEYDLPFDAVFINVQEFEFENRDMFEEEINYGAKSDILRMAILEREGGIYADIDQECLQSFDALRHSFHFVIGIQPLDTNFVQLGIGLIASVAHHPFLLYAIKSLQNNKNIKQIIVKTGPIFYTRCYIQCCGRTGLHDVALPASYFYPCGYTQKGQSIEEWNKPEALAVHHWAGSWLGKEAFVPGTFK